MPSPSSSSLSVRVLNSIDEYNNTSVKITSHYEDEDIDFIGHCNLSKSQTILKQTSSTSSASMALKDDNEDENNQTDLLMHSSATQLSSLPNSDPLVDMSFQPAPVSIIIEDLAPPTSQTETLEQHLLEINPEDEQEIISNDIETSLNVTPKNNPWLSIDVASPENGSSIKKIQWPRDATQVNFDLVLNLVSTLKSCGKDPTQLRRYLTFSSLSALLRQAEKTFQALPNVIPVCLSDDTSLTVLGDTHGQFFDVLKVFKENGYPSPINRYLVNGDFVDRGSWGLETAVTLFAFKLLYPDAMYLTRGNHETLYCTEVYGFFEECQHKYSKSMHDKFHNVFARLPLACVILPAGCSPDRLLNVAQSTDLRVGDGEGALVIHGGLFRDIDGSIGTLKRLQSVKRDIKDPLDEYLLDTLWSDPKSNDGLEDNIMRGCATLFGPDITTSFLTQHGLSLIIRSHEGPDAREKRPEMQNDMMGGWAIDQTCCNSEAPLLITIFSAPDYPQGPTSRNNLGAYIRFNKGSLEHTFFQFTAAPRPHARTYYAAKTSNFTDMDIDSDGN